MSLLPGPAYHFRTPAQWACVHASGLAETLVLDSKSGVDCGFIDCPAEAVSLSVRGRLFWVDKCHSLFAAGPETPYRGIQGPAVGRIHRLVAGKEYVWALADCAPAGGKSDKVSRRLVQVDERSLHVLINRDVGNVIDVAAAAKDGLWLLGPRTLRRISAKGAPAGRVRALAEGARAIAGAAGRLALLSEDGRRVALLDPVSGDSVSIDLTRVAGPGWSGEKAMLSGTGAAFLIDGTIGTERGFLLLDRDGNLLATGSWRDGLAPDLLAGAGDDLLGLFGEAGGQRIRRFGGLGRPGSERRMTPPLETISPAGTWLRAEITARLPERATLGLRWAATDDEALAATVEGIFADSSIPMSRRLERVELLLQGLWSKTFTYIGEAHDAPAPGERFAFPLHAAAGHLLWVDIKVARNSADAAPEIETLLVIHEATSLMDDLPAIYSGEGDRDGTMRRLVGVLEATTQGIDHRVARLAARLDPDRTSVRWLPDLAAMLGLPFHDALSADMQRRLVKAAPAILSRRGTRLGLLAMLEALFPGRPIQVVDRTELLIPISLGRDGVGGSALPAMLSGPSTRIPKLNARLVLNTTGLCKANACTDASIAPGPEVLVSIPARGREQQRYRDSLAQMIEAMVPSGVRVRLRWTQWHEHGRTRPADVLTDLSAPERLSLGLGPALGQARTGGRPAARLDGQGATPANHRLL
jgi:phage tail-like protein